MTPQHLSGQPKLHLRAVSRTALQDAGRNFGLAPIALLLASACAAQDLREITVQPARDYLPDAGVATLTDTPASLAPFATSTVGRALLQDRGVTSMGDALRTVPGVSAVNGIGNFNARVRFRGFLATSQLKNGFRQQVNFAVTEFQNVETLEVLRGQASSLYGRFEPGGVLNIVTKPAGAQVREVALSVGDDGQRRGTFDLGGRSEMIDWRLNGALERSDTFRDFVGNDTNFLAPTVTFKLSSSTRVSFEGEWLERNGAFDRGFAWGAGLSPAALQTLQNLPAQRFLGEPTDRFANRTQWGAVVLRHRLGEHSELRAGLASSRAQSDGAYFFPTGTNPLISATGQLSRRFQTTADETQDRMAHVQATGRAGWGGWVHTWLAGVETNRSYDTSRIQRATTNALIDIRNPVYGAAPAPTPTAISNTRASNDTTALYLQNETALSEQWRLTLGVRSEQIESVFEDRASNNRRSSKVTATTGRVGISFAPQPGTLLLANWGQSFSPEVTARGLVGGAQPVPSSGKQWELGVRQQLWADKLQASAVIFDIERTNVRVADTVTPTLDRQVGAQRSRGLELEFSGRPSPNWQVVASATSMQAEISADTNAALVGRQLAQTPETTAALWLRHDLSDRLALAGGLNYTAKRFVDAANTFSIPSGTRLDLAVLGQITRAVRWQLNLLNATNARLYESGNTTSNFYPGQPRTLRASVVAKF